MLRYSLLCKPCFPYGGNLCLWARESRWCIPISVSICTFRRTVTSGVPWVSQFYHRATKSSLNHVRKQNLLASSVRDSRARCSKFTLLTLTTVVLCWHFASASAHLPLHSSSYLMSPYYPCTTAIILAWAFLDYDSKWSIFILTIKYYGTFKQIMAQNYVHKKEV